MELIKYLSSPQAVEDVQALLAEAAMPVREGRAAGRVGPFRWAYVDPAEAWTLFRLESEIGQDKYLHAYFRPDGEVLYLSGDQMREALRGPKDAVLQPAKVQRYIVTDLGAAVQVLRLRTGWTFHEAMARVGAVAVREMVDVDAADLPCAICAVLLAAHKVATLQP